MQPSPLPRIDVERGQDSLMLDATVDLNKLRDLETGIRTRLALAAVFEDRDGSPSYRTLADPSGKADFHHPDSFVLALTDNGAQM